MPLGNSRVHLTRWLESLAGAAASVLFPSGCRLRGGVADAGGSRPEKHLLHFEERWEAVRDAFVIREGDQVDNLQILLLDDDMTSGATLDAL
jgi:predicted amidophosphoribosyltransferase